MNETKLPGGWKLVPIEPTPKMIDATWLQDLGGLSHNRRNRKIYELMLAAAPAAPTTWSSATAPGPDGMQHCIAVPGMPSAARDAALEEAARIVEARCIGYSADDEALAEIAEAIRALKSIAGPVATPAPVQQAAPSELVCSHWNAETRARYNFKCNACEDGLKQRPGAAPAQPVIPVQQAALSGDLGKAMRQAYNLGQTYWQQADSESWSQQDKSNVTADKFAKLLAETVATFAAPAQPVGLSERVAELEAELTNIANAKNVDFESADEFRDWAKSRARFTLDRAILAAKEAP